MRYRLGAAGGLALVVAGTAVAVDTSRGMLPLAEEMLGQAEWWLAGAAVLLAVAHLHHRVWLIAPTALAVVATAVHVSRNGGWSGTLPTLAVLTAAVGFGMVVASGGRAQSSVDPSMSFVAVLLPRRLAFGPADRTPEHLDLKVFVSTVTVDLTAARPPGVPVILDVTCIASQVRLFLPESWPVVVGSSSARPGQVTGRLETTSTYLDPRGQEEPLMLLARQRHQRLGQPGEERPGATVVLNLYIVGGRLWLAHR